MLTDVATVGNIEKRVTTGEDNPGVPYDFVELTIGSRNWFVTTFPNRYRRGQKVNVHMYPTITGNGHTVYIAYDVS